MTNQNLRELLEQLHKELENTETVDEKGRELLSHLNADIQKLLASPGSINAQSDASALRNIKETINRLEVTHPTLTMAISEFMSILSNAGI